MATNSLIHADIFFFISTIALVVVSIGLIIALVYSIKILKNVSDISAKVKEEGERIVSDVRELRHVLRNEGLKWKGVAGLIRGFFGTRKKD